MALEAEKLICVIDGPILDEMGRLIRFLTLEDADRLIRERAQQSEIAASYVRATGEEDSTKSPNGNVCSSTFQNGVHGNGFWSSGFAIGGQERLSRSNCYLSELAATAYVCRVSRLKKQKRLPYEVFLATIYNIGVDFILGRCSKSLSARWEYRWSTIEGIVSKRWSWYNGC